MAVVRVPFAAAQAQAVPPFLINVQVEGHFGFAQGFGKLQGVFNRNGFVFPGVPQEAGRRLSGYLEFIGESLDQVFRGVFTQQIVF